MNSELSCVLVLVIGSWLAHWLVVPLLMGHKKFGEGFTNGLISAALIVLFSAIYKLFDIWCGSSVFR